MNDAGLPRAAAMDRAIEPARPEILVIDDDSTFNDRLDAKLGSTFRCHLVRNGEEGLSYLEHRQPSLVLLDYEFPGGRNGLEILRLIKSQHRDLPVIMISVHGDVAIVADAIRQGAFDYIAKSDGLAIIQRRIENAFSQLRASQLAEYRDQTGAATDGERRKLDGTSSLIQRTNEDLAIAARTDFPVLLLGEPGTGKTHAARAIHNLSRRANHPFERLDLAMTPPTLAPDKLFGHARWAFTDARMECPGILELVGRGSFFLDEIGELEKDIQKQLLTVAQEGIYTRIGENKRRIVGCRLITATNRNLSHEVRAGNFRQDLFDRLGVFVVTIPPLRARPEDIPPLARLLVAREAAGSGVDGPVDIADEAIDYLTKQPWPANVRGLETAIRRALAWSASSTLHVRDFQRRGGTWAEPSSAAILPYSEAKEIAELEFKRDYVTKAMKAAGGVVNQAARLAGIFPASFRRLMRELDMDAGGQ